MGAGRATQSDRSKLSSTFVNIIESPGHAELAGGISEGRGMMAEFDRIGIRYKYSLVQDYGEFMVAMGKTLTEGVREFKAIPMLHFSMHGSSEGIQLTDRRFLDWRDLSWKLRLLNQAFARRLVVCMSSCYGLSGYKTLLEGMAVGELTNVPPYGLLVGNVRRQFHGMRPRSGLSPSIVF